MSAVGKMAREVFAEFRRAHLLRLWLCLCVCWWDALDVGGAAPKPDVPPQIKPAELEKAIGRGVDFLVRRQNKDGSWGSARNTKDLNIYAPVPGAHHAFRCAVTALCIQALIETGAINTNAAARQAADRGESWLLENLPNLRRADAVALYNVWGHAYGLQALAAMCRRETNNAARRARIQEIMRGQIELLQRYESVDGGWGYYDFKAHTQKPNTDSLSFVNAAVLLAFHQARSAGVEAPEKLVRRAVAATQRQRKSDNSYLYGEYLKYQPARLVNRPAGSLGRSQACNLALRLYGDATITDAVLKEWLDRLVARNGWLSIGRKRPVPHESWFQVAGYFFYYGHYYAALCMEQLPAADASPYRRHIAGILLALQEKDGSWWDYPLYDYHQQYGTAFALMSLARCRGL